MLISKQFWQFPMGVLVKNVIIIFAKFQKVRALLYEESNCK